MAERINVKVIAELYDGQVKPVEVIIGDQRISILRILSAQAIQARKDGSGNSGMRFLVRSSRRDFVLVYDQRWWVEVG